MGWRSDRGCPPQSVGSARRQPSAARRRRWCCRGPRELAFLSACQTATGSTQAPDEAIHLAAAIQLLGYRHVIATLWSIYDSPAPDIADTVYAALTATGRPDANYAAHALHHAVTALRAKYPTEPLAWAPYLHTGP